jgi:ADP-heptose:LPS heptosyltransferase
VNILFITSTRIGDVVLSTGLLDHLIKAYPGAKITVACGPAAAPLLADCPHLARVHVMAKRRYTGHWWDLWHATRGTRWDLIVDLRSSLISWFLRAGRRRVYRSWLADRKSRKVEDLGRVLDLTPPPSPRLWISDETRARALSHLPKKAKVLVLGPASIVAAKQWPAERFAELARRLTVIGAPLEAASVVVLGGSGERETAQRALASVDTARAINLAGELSLLEAASIMEASDLYIGNDSGPMHMAAAVGAPTLGLFGPSQYFAYGPWGPRTAKIRAKTLDGLAKQPHYRQRLTHDYMMDLTVDEVEQAARKLLSRVATEGEWPP